MSCQVNEAAHLQVVQRRELEPPQRPDVVRRLAAVEEELVARVRVHPEALRLVSQGHRVPVCAWPSAAYASAQGMQVRRWHHTTGGQASGKPHYYGAAALPLTKS